MYGKATFIKVNQLRYDSLSKKYQGTSVQVLIAFNGMKHGVGALTSVWTILDIFLS